MAIRETLQRILTDYQHAKSQPLKDHPLAKFIGDEAELAVRDALGELGQGLLVEGSPGRTTAASKSLVRIHLPFFALSSGEQ